MRKDKINYYLDIAQTVSERGTCMRRRFGAIIVKNDEIIAAGYNGAPRGRRHCNELGRCVRNELNIPHGERYELCRSVHAEANAIISARRSDMIGSSIYLACTDPSGGNPISGTNCCSMCKRLVINAGIANVVVRDTYENYRIIDVSEWVENDESLEGRMGY